jgi:hypothetical protein
VSCYCICFLSKCCVCTQDEVLHIQYIISTSTSKSNQCLKVWLGTFSTLKSVLLLYLLPLKVLCEYTKELLYLLPLKVLCVCTQDEVLHIQYIISTSTSKSNQCLKVWLGTFSTLKSVLLLYLLPLKVLCECTKELLYLLPLKVLCVCTQDEVLHIQYIISTSTSKSNQCLKVWLGTFSTLCIASGAPISMSCEWVGWIYK